MGPAELRSAQPARFHASLALLREIFDRSADGIAIIALDGRYLEQNAAHARLIGYTIDELRELTPAVHVGQPVFDRIHDALRRTGAYRGELLSVGKDGQRHTIELSAFTVHTEDGVPAAFVGIKRDVTHRKHAEISLHRQYTQLQAIYRMTSALLTAPELAAVYEEGLACLCESLGADRASILLHDDDGVMRFQAWVGLSDDYRAAIEAHVARVDTDIDPESVVVADIGADPALADLHEAAAAEGVAAIVFIPLVYQRRLLGKFLVHYDRARVPAPADLQLARSITAHIAIAIQRRRAEEELARREREFEALAEHAPDIITRLDRDLRYLYVNPAVTPITGLAPAALIGRTTRELGMPVDLIHRWEAVVRSVFDAGVEGDLEFAFQTPAGHRHFQARITPESFADGAVHTVLAITRDVTALKRAEQRQRILAELGKALVSHREYASALDAVARLIVMHVADGCAIDLVDDDGQLRRLATADRDPERGALAAELERRFRTPRDAPAGNAAAVSTGRPQLHAVVDDALLRALSSCEEHFQLWQQLGMTSCMCVPLTARGRTLGVVTILSHTVDRRFDADDLAFVEEITDRAALAVDNLRLYEDMRAASRAKSDFMATVSHELRTPLNAIMGYSDLLELQVAGKLNERQFDQVARIRTSTTHLLGVIEEILTFSRVEAGKEDVHLETTTIAALVREAAVMIEPAALEKGLLFLTDVPDTPWRLTTDRVKLRQVLLNVLGNAVKFTTEGSVMLAVIVEQEDVTFVVRDTGPGIAPEHLDRIFEPFWQVDTGPTRRRGGTGLGLTVSRQLMTLLGGDLKVESEPGAGTTFRIRLACPLTTEPGDGNR